MNLIEQIANIVSYDFMQNALISGVFLSVVLAVVGLHLVTHRLTFIADTLGHINMGGVALTYLLAPVIALSLFSSLLIIMTWSILGGVLIEYLRSKYKDNKEVAILIVYAMAIALTMIFLNLSTSANTGFLNLLFGNINAISNQEVIVVVVFSIVILIVMQLINKKLFIIAFDQEVSELYGVKYTFYRYLFIILVTITTTLAIKILGVLLVSSMMIIPNLSAINLSKNLKQTKYFAIILTEISMIFGIFMAYFLNLSASAVIVIVAIVIYGLTVVYKSKFS